MSPNFDGRGVVAGLRRRWVLVVVRLGWARRAGCWSTAGGVGPSCRGTGAVGRGPRSGRAGGIRRSAQNRSPQNRSPQNGSPRTGQHGQVTAWLPGGAPGSGRRRVGRRTRARVLTRPGAALVSAVSATRVALTSKPNLPNFRRHLSNHPDRSGQDRSEKASSGKVGKYSRPRRKHKPAPWTSQVASGEIQPFGAPSRRAHQPQRPSPTPKSSLIQVTINRICAACHRSSRATADRADRIPTTGGHRHCRCQVFVNVAAHHQVPAPVAPTSQPG